MLATKRYKYFQKAKFSISQILQIPKETLAIVDVWFAVHEYLFEQWTGKEIESFIELIHLKSSRNRKSNTHIFQAMMSLPGLLKNSRGEIITFEDFERLIESKIVLHMKAHSCGLLYGELGFEKLVKCSEMEIVTNDQVTNLLQTLSDLDIDQLARVLADAQGNIEILKQAVVKPIKVTNIQSNPKSSVRFFPVVSSNKRSHAQIEESEEVQLSEDQRQGQRLPNNVPEFSKSKEEEN